MIVNEKITIKTNPSNYRHYIEHGYLINKCGDEIEIKIKHLPKSSHVKIQCRCDNCEDEKLVSYYNYNIYLEKHLIYTCYKCCNVKNKLTCFQKYGKFYSATKEYKNKVETTINERYGSKEGYSNFIRDITKERVTEKYGTDNVFRIESVKNKIKSTLLERYGVEHALQCPTFFQKSQTTGFKYNEYNKVRYQGSYELDFLKFFEKLNIKVTKCKSIKYTLNESKKVYFPDFYLPEYNLIVEIKSKYYYEKEFEKNQMKKEYSIKSGYNFIFIIDKDYTEIENIINYKKS